MTLGVCQAEVEGEVHVGLNTEYIWRGVDQGGDSMAEAGVDLAATYGGFDFSAGIWYASVHGSGLDEADYYAEIAKTYGCFTLAVGYIYYDYPSDNFGPGFDNLGELYFKAGTRMWDTDFAVTYFWDIQGDNDGYSELTIDRAFPLSECVSLGVGGTFSFDWETSDVHHYGLSASLDWAYNEVLTVSPYVSVTFAEDGAQNGALGYYNQGDEIFGGLILTASF